MTGKAWVFTGVRILSHRFPLGRINEACPNAAAGTAIRTARVAAPDVIEEGR